MTYSKCYKKNTFFFLSCAVLSLVLAVQPHSVKNITSVANTWRDLMMKKNWILLDNPFIYINEHFLNYSVPVSHALVHAVE